MSDILSSDWSLSLGGLAGLAVATFVLFVVYARAQNATTKRTKVSKSTRTVVLTGPMAGGKTSLFSKLLYGHAPATHTSMKENEGLVRQRWPVTGAKEALLDKSEKDSAEPTPLPKPVQVVDTPGHARLRARALAQFVPAADGLVFVVDGAQGLTGQRVREAGEHLHLLLSLLPLLPTAPPVLILLSKSDALPASSSSSTSKTLDRAKLALARELERRRTAAASASNSAGARLEGLEAPAASAASSLSLTSLWEMLIGANQAAERPAVSLPSDEAEILGGEAFAFEGAFEWQKLAESGVEVEWAVGSVKGGEGLEGLYEWVEKL